MGFNCFRPDGGRSLRDNNTSEPVRPKLRPVNSNSSTISAKKASRMSRRLGSADSQVSRSSTVSNDSIAKLPPCKRLSDPKIEAMMMPVPPEPRPSRCLRLSQPRIYSDIIDGMKASKGCRDWRNFDVFYADDVDMSVSAELVARRRAADYERKLRQLNSFSSDDVEADLIA